MNFKYVQYSDDILLTRFKCEAHQINHYFKKHALANHKNNMSRLYLVLDEKNTVAGFYTLSNAAISCLELPEDIRSTLPEYPIPAIRLGRMGRDLNFKGKLRGSDILQHVFEVTYEQSKLSACFGLVVDAKDQYSERLYRNNDFQDLLIVKEGQQSYPKPMFIIMKTIEELILSVEK